MTTLRALSALLFAATAAACAPATPELEGDEETTAHDERALTGAKVYVVTRQDYRKCISPMCGGVYVREVNRQSTTCLDGSKQSECYVGELDLSALSLGEEQAQDLRDRAMQQQVLFTGSLSLLQGDIAKLSVAQAREAVTDAVATGTHYFVVPSGITCVTSPCPSLRARNLNASSSKLLTSLDLAALGLDDADTAALHEAAYGEGLVVAGLITTKGANKTLRASQAYAIVTPERTLCLSDDACGKGQACDHSECLSNCPPDMMCPAVCWGVCAAASEPAPPAGDSCQSACGGASSDESCWCDSACGFYGDCCTDYAAACL